MEVAGLALAIPGVVELCFKYGRKLVHTSQAYRKADIQLEHTTLRLEFCWLRLENQLSLVKHLAPHMDEQHVRVHTQYLGVLQFKLEIAQSKLDSFIVSGRGHAPLVSPVNEPKKTTNAKKFKYALLKDTLDEAVSDLRTWQQDFEPSWYLLCKSPDPEVDDQLSIIEKQRTAPLRLGLPLGPLMVAQNMRKEIRKTESGNAPSSSVFLQPTNTTRENIKSLSYSAVQMTRHTEDGQWVLLDPIACTERSSKSAMLKDVRNLAIKLDTSDPFTFGLLRCKGVLKDGKSGLAQGASPEYSFIFRLPSSHPEVYSLRHRLLGGHPLENESLSCRFDLAKQIVRAVSYVHIYGFVHKNIRPETILLLRDNRSYSQEDPKSIHEERAETAVLVGFNVVRDAEGKTQRISDNDWQKNIYRHPRRQGRAPEVDYEMRHDIYSIGVCLLEIGLWDTFVAYDGSTEKGSRQASNYSFPRNADDVKSYLLGLARGKLQQKMGSKYSKVVETCLTCLDQGNIDFGDEDEFQDEDGIAVDIRYIEKVVMKLGEIVV